MYSEENTYPDRTNKVRDFYFEFSQKRANVFGSFSSVAIIWILLLIEPQNMVQNVFSRNYTDCFPMAQD